MQNKLGVRGVQEGVSREKRAYAAAACVESQAQFRVLLLHEEGPLLNKEHKEYGKMTKMNFIPQQITPNYT